MTGCLVTQNAEWNDRKAEIWNRRRNQLGGVTHQEKKQQQNSVFGSCSVFSITADRR